MMDYFSILPEECISLILSMALTSPRDAARSSAIKPFKALADSDSVWEKLLPSDYQQIISKSASPPVGFSTMSKKQLYFSLCDSPLLLDGGKLSFGLDRESGKKCYTLPMLQLEIVAWVMPEGQFWGWMPLAELESSYSQAAQLERGPHLDIWGRIETAMLSTKTNYAAYLILKIADGHFGLESLPLKSSVRIKRENDTVFLTLETSTSSPGVQNGRLPQMRRDGWMEVELGEFYYDEGDDGEVEIRLWEDRLWEDTGHMGGLVVGGIEVRPKTTA